MGRWRKKGRGRSRKTIPILETAVLGYPIVNAFRTRGLNETGLKYAIYDTTGYDVSVNKWSDPKKGVAMAIGLIALATIGKQVANRTGANRLVKKATGGIFSLA